MPVMRCRSEGKPGWKYGEEGHCYTYTQGNEESERQAKEKAGKQGQAIEINRR